MELLRRKWAVLKAYRKVSASWSRFERKVPVDVLTCENGDWFTSFAQWEMEKEEYPFDDRVKASDFSDSLGVFLNEFLEIHSTFFEKREEIEIKPGESSSIQVDSAVEEEEEQVLAMVYEMEKTPQQPQAKEFNHIDSVYGDCTRILEGLICFLSISNHVHPEHNSASGEPDRDGHSKNSKDNYGSISDEEDAYVGMVDGDNDQDIASDGNEKGCLEYHAKLWDVVCILIKCEKYQKWILNEKQSIFTRILACLIAPNVSIEERRKILTVMRLILSTPEAVKNFCTLETVSSISKHILDIKITNVKDEIEAEAVMLQRETMKMIRDLVDRCNLEESGDNGDLLYISKLVSSALMGLQQAHRMFSGDWGNSVVPTYSSSHNQLSYHAVNIVPSKLHSTPHFDIWEYRGTPLAAPSSPFISPTSSPSPEPSQPITSGFVYGVPTKEELQRVKDCLQKYHITETTVALEREESSLPDRESDKNKVGSWMPSVVVCLMNFAEQLLRSSSNLSDVALNAIAFFSLQKDIIETLHCLIFQITAPVSSVQDTLENTEENDEVTSEASRNINIHVPSFQLFLKMQGFSYIRTILDLLESQSCGLSTNTTSQRSKTANSSRTVHRHKLWLHRFCFSFLKSGCSLGMDAPLILQPNEDLTILCQFRSIQNLIITIEKSVNLEARMDAIRLLRKVICGQPSFVVISEIFQLRTRLLKILQENSNYVHTARIGKFCNSICILLETEALAAGKSSYGSLSDLFEGYARIALQHFLSRDVSPFVMQLLSALGRFANALLFFGFEKPILSSLTVSLLIDALHACVLHAKDEIRSISGNIHNAIFLLLEFLCYVFELHGKMPVVASLNDTEYNALQSVLVELLTTRCPPDIFELALWAFQRSLLSLAIHLNEPAEPGGVDAFSKLLTCMSRLLPDSKIESLCYGLTELLRLAHACDFGKCNDRQKRGSFLAKLFLSNDCFGVSFNILNKCITLLKTLCEDNDLTASTYSTKRSELAKSIRACLFLVAQLVEFDAMLKNEFLEKFGLVSLLDILLSSQIWFQFDLLICDIIIRLATTSSTNPREGNRTILAGIKYIHSSTISVVISNTIEPCSPPHLLMNWYPPSNVNQAQYQAPVVQRSVKIGSGNNQTISPGQTLLSSSAGDILSSPTPTHTSGSFIAFSGEDVDRFSDSMEYYLPKSRNPRESDLSGEYGETIEKMIQAKVFASEYPVMLARTLKITSVEAATLLMLAVERTSPTLPPIGNCESFPSVNLAMGFNLQHQKEMIQLITAMAQTNSMNACYLTLAKCAETSLQMAKSLILSAAAVSRYESAGSTSAKLDSGLLYMRLFTAVCEHDISIVPISLLKEGMETVSTPPIQEDVSSSSKSMKDGEAYQGEESDMETETDEEQQYFKTPSFSTLCIEVFHYLCNIQHPAAFIHYGSAASHTTCQGERELPPIAYPVLIPSAAKGFKTSLKFRPSNLSVGTTPVFSIELHDNSSAPAFSTPSGRICVYLCHAHTDARANLGGVGSQRKNSMVSRERSREAESAITSKSFCVSCELSILVEIELNLSNGDEKSWKAQYLLPKKSDYCMSAACCNALPCILGGTNRKWNILSLSFKEDLMVRLDRTPLRPIKDTCAAPYINSLQEDQSALLSVFSFPRSLENDQQEQSNKQCDCMEFEGDISEIAMFELGSPKPLLVSKFVAPTVSTAPNITYHGHLSLRDHAVACSLIESVLNILCNSLNLSDANTGTCKNDTDGLVKDSIILLRSIDHLVKGDSKNREELSRLNGYTIISKISLYIINNFGDIQLKKSVINILISLCFDANCDDADIASNSPTKDASSIWDSIESDDTVPINKECIGTIIDEMSLSNLVDLIPYFDEQTRYHALRKLGRCLGTCKINLSRFFSWIGIQKWLNLTGQKEAMKQSDGCDNLIVDIVAGSLPVLGIQDIEFLFKFITAAPAIPGLEENLDSDVLRPFIRVRVQLLREIVEKAIDSETVFNLISSCSEAYFRANNLGSVSFLPSSALFCASILRSPFCEIQLLGLHLFGICCEKSGRDRILEQVNLDEYKEFMAHFVERLVTDAPIPGMQVGVSQPLVEWILSFSTMETRRLSTSLSALISEYGGRAGVTLHVRAAPTRSALVNVCHCEYFAKSDKTSSCYLSRTLDNPFLVRTIFRLLRDAGENLQLFTLKSLKDLLCAHPSNVDSLLKQRWLYWVASYLRPHHIYERSSKSKEPDPHLHTSGKLKKNSYYYHPSPDVEKLAHQLIRMILLSDLEKRHPFILHQLNAAYVEIEGDNATTPGDLPSPNPGLSYSQSFLGTMLLELMRNLEPALLRSNELGGEGQIQFFTNVVSLFRCVKMGPLLSAKVLEAIDHQVCETTAAMRELMKDCGLFDLRNDLIESVLSCGAACPATVEFLFSYNFQAVAHQSWFRSLAGCNGLQRMLLIMHETEDLDLRHCMMYNLKYVLGNIEENREVLRQALQSGSDVEKIFSSHNTSQCIDCNQFVHEVTTFTVAGKEISDAAISCLVRWYFGDCRTELMQQRKDYLLNSVSHCQGLIEPTVKFCESQKWLNEEPSSPDVVAAIALSINYLNNISHVV